LTAKKPHQFHPKETDLSNNLAWPKGIFAVTLFTENLEADKAFYQRVFGLPIDFEDPTSAVFKFGDTLINLLKIEQADELIAPAKVANREAGTRFLFTISVEDVDELCAIYGRRTPDDNKSIQATKPQNKRISH
jgi:catechol 2,3-dioxygenase-like lactoylglutathione lyase family enzyme